MESCLRRRLSFIIGSSLEKQFRKFEIHYKMIGHMELPEMSKTEKTSYLHTFGRKKSTKAD